MSIQNIQDHKLQWLRNKSFRVKISTSEGQHDAWLQENVEEKSWDKSINPVNNHCTFFFEDPADAEKFRDHFQGDSRTVDFG